MEKEEFIKMEEGKWYEITAIPNFFRKYINKFEKYNRRLKYVNFSSLGLEFYDNWENIPFKRVVKFKRIGGQKH